MRHAPGGCSWRAMITLFACSEHPTGLSGRTAAKHVHDHVLACSDVWGLCGCWMAGQIGISDLDSHVRHILHWMRVVTQRHSDATRGGVISRVCGWAPGHGGEPMNMGQEKYEQGSSKDIHGCVDGHTWVCRSLGTVVSVCTHREYVRRA